MFAFLSLLFMSCLFGLAFIARYFLDYHLQRTTNFFLSMAIRRQSFDEIVCELFFLSFFSFRLALINSLPDRLCPNNNIFSFFIATSTNIWATDDTAGSDGLKVTTVHDEKTDSLPLAPTFAPETDDAAGVDEENVNTGGDEQTDSLLLAPETNDAAGTDEVEAPTGGD